MFNEDDFDFEKRILTSKLDIKEDDFENRIITTTFDGAENSNINWIGNLGFPQAIEKKIKGYTNFTRMSSPAHLLLIGCPQKYVSKILDAISIETNSYSRLIEDAYMRQDTLVANLTSVSEGAFLCFTKIGSLSSELMHILQQSIMDSQLSITIGKGTAARHISIDLPKFSVIIAADNIAQIPKEMIESFYEIIDFKKYDYDLRVMFINDFAEKHNLVFAEDVKERLAKQFTQYDQLNIQLIEIRNQARESNVREITESLLTETLDAIPELDKIDEMDGRSFELFTGDLLFRNGFENINVTQASYDFGVDVIAEKDDVKYAIQCKRYNGPIGVSAVQEVIASKSLHDCHVACVLTNSSFTPAAVELAKKNLVILWDRKKLQKFIDNANR